MFKVSLLHRSVIFLFPFFFSVFAFSQASNPLTTEFLEGLPPDVREELQLNNAVKKEEDLEKLFRADTEFDKTKDVLEKIRYELAGIEKRLSQSNGDDSGKLKRFGETFFSTIQSSFMPVNVPSAAGSYILDVGDTLKVMLSGGASSSAMSKSDENQMIQRDGTVSLPNLGKITLAGLTLAQAEETLGTYVDKASPGTSVYISLAKLRDIQVLMLGGTVSPGIFTLSGGSSVLTAINAAGGITKQGSFRKIEHKRNGEVVSVIDLYDIFIDGNISFESQLRSGDAILIHPVSNLIPVSGGVNNEALFEALPGETASDLIKFAGGFSSAFDGHKSIFVKRADLASNSIVDIPINKLDEFKLQSRDIILVPSFASIEEPAREVTIEGMVNRPGQYYVNEGERLSDLIKKAGGYKQNAYEFGAGLFRLGAIEAEQEFAQQSYFEIINTLISNLAQPGVSASPEIIGLLSEELRSRRNTGRVIAEFDLNKLQENPSLDMTLADKDRIIIPELQKVVYLFGDFRNPSNITYNPNYNIQDYLLIAGGANESAYDELIVIDPSGKSQVYRNRLFARDKIDIYPGSVIYASRDIGKVDPVRYVANISPILSSLALSLASLNAIND